MRKFIAGIVVGAVVASAGAVYADSTIQAYVASNVSFKFNGVQKSVDTGYTVLNYQGRTYVPARFVAENLGAAVGWDNATSTVMIDSASASSSSGGSSSTNGQTVGHYTFSNYSMYTDFGGDTNVRGEVTNNDTAEHTVQFTINFYDAKSNLLGSAYGSAQLAPGQKKSFDATTGESLSGVSVYSFQVDDEF